MIHPDDIKTFINTSYGVTCDIKRLAGENENYLVNTSEGKKAVLKLAGEDTTADMIATEHQAIEQLVLDDLKVCLPRIIPTRSGEIQAVMETDANGPLRGRLLEFVGDTPWCQALPADDLQLKNPGTVIGQMHRSLAGIDHPAALRTHHWDLTKADQHRKKIADIGNPLHRRIPEEDTHAP